MFQAEICIGPKFATYKTSLAEICHSIGQKFAMYKTSQARLPQSLWEVHKVPWPLTFYSVYTSSPSCFYKQTTASFSESYNVRMSSNIWAALTCIIICLNLMICACTCISIHVHVHVHCTCKSCVHVHVVYMYMLYTCTFNQICSCLVLKMKIDFKQCILTLGLGGSSVSFTSIGNGLTWGIENPMTNMITITMVIRRMRAEMCQSVRV